MTRVRRPSTHSLRLRPGQAAMSALCARPDLNLDLSSGGLFLGDELHAGSVNGADTWNLPCGLRCFKCDDLKARLAAQVHDAVFGFDVESDGLQRFASRQTIPDHMGNALILLLRQIVLESRCDSKFVYYVLDAVYLARDLSHFGLVLFGGN